MISTAIILAGGFGTRLRTVVNDVPKPMAPVNGRPFLEYELDYLHANGIRHVILSVGYLSEVIVAHFGNRYREMNLVYVKEEVPMGTGGGIRMAMEHVSESNVVVLNGDSFFDVDIRDMYERYTDLNLDIMLASRTVPDASRYGTLVTGDIIGKSANGEVKPIVAFNEKKSVAQPGIINGGVYILNKASFMQHTEPNTNFSIEKEYFEPMVKVLKCGSYMSEGYFIDIGIPEDYNKAQLEFKKFKY